MSAQQSGITEQQYRDEWVSKTGRAPSDIYIPEALRETSDSDTPANGQAATEDRGQ